jgi:hydroxypyruvate isomerase
MPKFCAHLGYQFNEVPFLERFAAAARAGYRAVEFPSPYTHEAGRLADLLSEWDLALVQFAAPMGGTGEKGIACHPGRRQELEDGVAKAIAYAEVLGCKMVHIMAGIAPAEVAADAAYATYIGNLRFAARELGKHSLTALVEPINSHDMPGYFIDRPSRAIRALDDCGEPNVRLLYDIYHAQVMEGGLSRFIEQHVARIGHVQVADAPDRHEPGTGEINFDFLFRLIDRVGYTGWIGCEYHPAGSTIAGLAWLQPWLRDAPSTT